MTLEIALVLTILLVALVLFISERLRMDLVALLVLSTLALTGLVDPAGAIAGFSNPAVIAVWAMFILSEGLTRTGIANILGRYLLRLAGPNELRMIVVIMLTGGGLSAFMNNIGVAALMLPVVMDLARRTRIPPSRLLMPMAFSTLLGGLTTQVGTPPNLLVSGALQDAGFEPFGLFDFTPVGGVALLAGTLFIALVGRALLPRIKPEQDSRRRSQRNLRTQYGLQARTFNIQIPKDSVLIGRTLGQSRIGSATGLIVLALVRGGRTETLPSRQTVLRAGDRLLVQGRLDRFNDFRRWSELVIEREAPVLQALMSEQVELLEVTVAEGSSLASELLHHYEFRRRYNANVLAIRRRDLVRRVNLSYVPLRAGDVLLIQCATETVQSLRNSPDFAEPREVSEDELREVYRLQERVFVARVPQDSQLAGDTLSRSRLGDAFDFRMLALFREGELVIMPDPDQALRGGDLVLIQGRPDDVEVLRGLQELNAEETNVPVIGEFQSDRLAMMEATLDPRSTLVGKPVQDTNFRDRYGLELVGIWRNGNVIRSNLDQLKLTLGDALLLLGPKQRLQMLEQDADFLVLTSTGGTIDARRAPLAAAIMAAVVAITLSGWMPIYIAAVTGASLMVLTGCLKMEEAYRAIEWRAIFLIAGMLPLGAAMQQTGADAYLGELLMEALGDLGPWPVIGGLYLATSLGTLVMPVPALVVLMSPIVLSVSAALGIEPYTGMMAVAMAAASFMSPISHPANILVMGPGGYRFRDYIKLGVPVAIVVMIATFLVLPVFWPLTPVN
ncbi:MAG: SLC13 family permease [Gammaproteobacteria bacterium]|nr:SLC13 family permease [Gammaproteobacteria bacterium]